MKASLDVEHPFDATGLQVFAPHRLHDQDAVRLAAEEVDAAVLLDNATTIIKAALDRVNPDAHLDRDTKALYALPFVISLCSAKASQRLVKDALGLFPKTRGSWEAYAYGWRLLLALLKAAFFLPIEPAVADLRLSAFNDYKHTLRNMARFAVLSSHVLLAIPTGCVSRPRSNSYAGMSSPLLRYRLPAIPHFIASAPDHLGHRRARRERKRFQDRTREWWATWTAAHRVDVSAFDELGVAVPSSRIEASDLSHAILSSCQCMLEELFRYLRRESLKDVIRAVYAPSVAGATTIAWTADNVVADTTDWGSSVPTNVHTSPRAALKELEVDLSNDEFPFDNENGFGPWRILLEHEARKALREADGKMYDVYLRKLRELSNGYLYGDNQKKLKGHEHQLTPLYEAKVTRDSRIIYQIHLIPDEDQKNERQVIRVWTIATHRQLDSRIWSTIDSQARMNDRLWGPKHGRMSRRRVYQQRCEARTPAQGRASQTSIRPTVWALDADDGQTAKGTRKGKGAKGHWS